MDNDVKFDELNDNKNIVFLRHKHRNFSLSEFMVNKGIVNNLKQAQQILILLVGVLFIISLFIYFNNQKNSPEIELKKYFKQERLLNSRFLNK